MAKKALTKRPSAVSAQELAQLIDAHSQAALAKERFHHTVTKGHLSRALHDNARLQAEVNQHKANAASVTAAQQQLAAEKEALDHKQATEKHVRDLAEGLRNRYSVDEKFAIDPMTGEFLQPEA